MPATNISVSSVHVSMPLSNLAIKYRMPGLVADRIFPVVNVKKETDVYYEFSKEELIDRDTLRGAGSEANEMEWDVTTEAYKAEEYALKQILPTRVENNADSPVRPRVSMSQKLQDVIMIGWERRVQAIVQNVLSITNTSAIGVAWDAASGQNPESDVDTARESVLRTSGRPANAILMNHDVANALKRWLKTTAQTTYSEFLDKDQLPPVLWGLETIIAKTVRNTANRNQTEALADIWNDNVTIFHKQVTPSLEAFTLGYTIRARNFRVKTWFDDKRDGTFIEVSVIQDEKLTAADAGYILTNAIA